MLSTGCAPLDAAAHCFVAGDITVILGGSGTGKSSILRNIALTASRHNHVLYVPLQDGPVENAAEKLIALEAGLKPAVLMDRLESADRICALEAGDRLKELDLGVYAADDTMFAMLLEAVAEDFMGEPDADIIEGEGFLLVDSLSMLDDGDLGYLIRALKGLAFGSDIAVIASVTGGADLLGEVADAGCVIHVEESDVSSADKMHLRATVLKDNWWSGVGRFVEFNLDRTTLAIDQKGIMVCETF